MGVIFTSAKYILKAHPDGVGGFQTYIRKTIQLNAKFVELIQACDLYEIVAPPSFSLTVIRLAPNKHSYTCEELNVLNKKLYDKLMERTDIFLTQTTLDDLFCIRFAVGSAHTNEAHIQKAYELLCQEANALIR